MDPQSLSEEPSGFLHCKKVPQWTHPHHREKIISNLIVNQLSWEPTAERPSQRRGDFHPPNAMLSVPPCGAISVAMDVFGGLPAEGELLTRSSIRLVKECKEIGIHLVMVTGGEPFCPKGSPRPL